MKNEKTARAGIIGTGFAARFHNFIRPATVTARTQSEGFVDAGYLCADYSNIEDFSMVPVTFKDDTIADVFALEIVLGGGCAECHYSCPE